MLLFKKKKSLPFRAAVTGAKVGCILWKSWKYKLSFKRRAIHMRRELMQCKTDCIKGIVGCNYSIKDISVSTPFPPVFRHYIHIRLQL